MTQNIFGGMGPNPAGTGLVGSTTNTTNSSTSTSSTGGLFGPGTAISSNGGGLFSNTSVATNPSTTTSSNPLLGGNSFAALSTNTMGGNGSGTSLFSFSKTANSGASASKPTSSLFGQPASSGASVTGSTPSPSGGVFGFSKPADSTSTTITGTGTTSTASTSNQVNTIGGLFGSNLFGKPAASSTTPSGASTSTQMGSKDGAANSQATGGPLGNLGSGTESASANKKDSASAAPQPAFNLFASNLAEKKDVTSTTSTPDTKPAEGEKPAEATPTSAVVAVPPPSMLRGKTIEEIVNRWSADLDTHIREFNRFAGEVAVWDRALIDNGSNLAALYSHVLVAEREYNEIEQSLDHIEQQQKDLVSTLDAYEKVTQEILGDKGGNLRALDTGPADTERDKNYILATDLHTQLDDLSGSLTQMIESVNSLSVASRGNEANSEEPMAQISQILSSHLESLQWLDGAVREVESKVAEVEKRAKESGIGVNPSLNSSSRSRNFGLR